MTRVSVLHTVPIPDPMRVARCRRVPELGPKILFFTGGTAMRKVSRALKAYTHNSIHLVTPFDSGGSSAEMRSAFDMLAVGDLRNRLMALADETVRGNPQIYELFQYRLSPGEEQQSLVEEVDRMIAGSHPLIAAIPDPLRHIIRNHIQCFCEHRPADFDLRDASIGNIVLVGGYLQTGRDIDAIIFLFSMLVKVLGTVRPVSAAALHLAVELENGETVVGQHNMTGKVVAPLRSPIRRMWLVQSLRDRSPARLDVTENVLKYLDGAELVCYPMGSFWTSIVANLIPGGVGRAIATSTAPKIYIPNAGHDPEQLGMKVHDCVRVLYETVAADVEGEVALTDALQFVLVDSRGADYEDRLDLDRLRATGVTIIDVPLARADGMLDAEAVSQVLLSLV